MNIRIYLFFALSVLPVAASLAQEDDTIQFIQGLPEAGTDSSLYDDVRLDDPPAHFRKVDPAGIPAELREELEQNSLFQGWRERPVWLDEKTGLYWIDLAEGGDVRSYGLDSEGQTVSVKQKTNSGKNTRSP